MTLPLDWTERGRELEVMLEECHAVVIVGSDPVATSEVALGAARTQSHTRHVAIADLFGEAPPLQELVTNEDAHGIVDSFLFGVSLNKIAQYIPESGELFILPSGSAPIDYDEMFTHPRWRRLVAGFREVNALLLIVAPANAPKLPQLVSATDGAVIVGDVVPAEVSVAQSLAWLRTKKTAPTAIAIEAPSVPVITGDSPLVASEARERPRRDRRRVAAGVGGLAVTAGLIAAAVWFAGRPFASAPKARVGKTPATAPVLPLTPDSLARQKAESTAKADSAAKASAAVAPPPVDSFPVLTAANAGDSAVAASYAVRLEQTNTPSGAILDLRGRYETVPAGTYGFDLKNRFYLLVAGAYPTKAGAESLLVRLHTQKVLAPGAGSVVSLPFAFLVEADVPAADVASRLKLLAARGKPVYALRQPSGVAHLYFGAYENPQSAALAVPQVRDAGLTPMLVYRIGRVF
ncbi:MAG: hypothetical protein ABJE47_15985 [bacterium]